MMKWRVLHKRNGSEKTLQTRAQKWAVSESEEAIALFETYH